MSVRHSMSETEENWRAADYFHFLCIHGTAIRPFLHKQRSGVGEGRTATEYKKQREC
jgi:hypothetical protein